MPGLLETLRNAMGLTRVMWPRPKSSRTHRIHPTEGKRKILKRAHGPLPQGVEGGCRCGDGSACRGLHPNQAIGVRAIQIDFGAGFLNVFEYGTGKLVPVLGSQGWRGYGLCSKGTPPPGTKTHCSEVAPTLRGALSFG